MKRLLLAAFLAALYLPALGSSSSGTHPDESYYLGISAEMDANGAWLTPTIDGQAKWFKPPLLYWAERLAYAVFGRGFFAGRLPAALCAIALALLTGALARRMYGEQAEASTALVLATTFGWLKFGRIAMMDAPMALAFAGAAYGLWRASEEDHPAQLLWTGLAAGSACLLKGPVGAVIVLALSIGFLALRRPGLLRSRHAAMAVGIGAGVGLPWYVASFVVHGRSFYDFFIVEQNLDRFRHPWTLTGEATLLLGFAISLVPWTLLFLPGLLALRRWRDPGLLLPAVWLGAVLLVFTIPSLKWPHYGLGCTPAAALLACREPPPRWARWGTCLVLAAIAAAALATLRWPLPFDATAALSGTTLALACAAVLVSRGRLAAGAGATGAGFALLLAFAIPAVNPPVIPPSALAKLANRDLYVYDFVPGIFTLSAGRTVHRVETADVERTLERGAVVILASSSLQRFSPAARSRLVPVARWEHIPGYLPASEVLRSWLSRDPALLFEPMLALELARAR
ncbi:MAG TPA: glycosyltransferase family 39 protein [Anaeromyxobacteraceae bacterium]|nr:glycosyltransferase family 39 protein [Anaeromyxobacteraceae bacterium]